jgi:hypothetical protein
MTNRRPTHLLDVPPDLEFGGQDGAEPDFAYFRTYPGAEYVETMWGVEGGPPPCPGYWWGVKVWLGQKSAI